MAWGFERVLILKCTAEVGSVKQGESNNPCLLVYFKMIAGMVEW